MAKNSQKSELVDTKRAASHDTINYYDIRYLNSTNHQHKKKTRMTKTYVTDWCLFRGVSTNINILNFDWDPLCKKEL